MALWRRRTDRRHPCQVGASWRRSTVGNNPIASAVCFVLNYLEKNVERMNYPVEEFWRNAA
jgi:hypothetical protein